MPRTYALKRLLEHGPMTRREIGECTGWGGRQMRRTLYQCVLMGVVMRRIDHGARCKHDRVLYEAAPQ